MKSLTSILSHFLYIYSHLAVIYISDRYIFLFGRSLEIFLHLFRFFFLFVFIISLCITLLGFSFNFPSLLSV